MRDKIGNLEKMGIKLMKFLKINKLIITRGNRGVILVEKKAKRLTPQLLQTKL